MTKDHNSKQPHEKKEGREENEETKQEDQEQQQHDIDQPNKKELIEKKGKKGEEETHQEKEKKNQIEERQQGQEEVSQKEEVIEMEKGRTLELHEEEVQQQQEPNKRKRKRVDELSTEPNSDANPKDPNDDDDKRNDDKCRNANMNTTNNDDDVNNDNNKRKHKSSIITSKKLRQNGRIENEAEDDNDDGNQETIIDSKKPYVDNNNIEENTKDKSQSNEEYDDNKDGDKEDKNRYNDGDNDDDDDDDNKPISHYKTRRQSSSSSHSSSSLSSSKIMKSIKRRKQSSMKNLKPSNAGTPSRVTGSNNDSSSNHVDVETMSSQHSVNISEKNSSNETASKYSCSKESNMDDDFEDEINDNKDNNNNDDVNKDDSSHKEVEEPIVDLESGTVTFSSSSVHEHFICKLCNGLYRDPFTISECLHTFCRSCIFFAFQDIGLTSCPRCNVSLGPDPFKAILFDRTLQELVDKLFPASKERDLKEEKIFLEALGKGMEEEDAFAFARNAIMSEEEDNDDKNDNNKTGKDKEKVKNNDSSGRSTLSGTTKSDQDPFDKPAIATRSQSKTNASKTDDTSYKSRNKQNDQKIQNYIPSQDEIHLRLYPLPSRGNGRRRDELPPLKKPLLQTSGRLRIIQLKKYIIQQMELEPALPLEPEFVEIRCNGDNVGDELSLTFISKTRWLDPTNDLTLHYGLNGNTSKMD